MKCIVHVIARNGPDKAIQEEANHYMRAELQTRTRKYRNEANRKTDPIEFARTCSPYHRSDWLVVEYLSHQLNGLEYIGS